MLFILGPLICFCGAFTSSRMHAVSADKSYCFYLPACSVWPLLLWTWWSMPTSFSWIFHSAATWRRLWRSGPPPSIVIYFTASETVHSFPRAPIQLDNISRIIFNVINDSRPSCRSMAVGGRERDSAWLFFRFCSSSCFYWYSLVFSFYLVSLSWWLALLVIKGPNFYPVYAPADFISLFSPSSPPRLISTGSRTRFL